MSVNNSNYGQNRNLSSSSNHVDFIKVQRSHQMSLSDKIDSFLQEVTEQVILPHCQLSQRLCIDSTLSFIYERKM